MSYGLELVRPQRFVLAKTALAYAMVAGGPAGVAPFAALWLRAQGAPLDSLGLLLALPLIARVVAARPLSVWAARFSNPWRPIVLLCLVAGVACLLAISSRWLPKNASLLWPSILTWWTVCFSIGACTPLMDEAVLTSTERGGALAYAKGVGAVGYIMANIAVGLALTQFGATAMTIWGAATALLAALMVGAFMARTGRSQPSPFNPPPRASKYAKAAPKGCLALALAAAALIEGSHGFNAIAMITWRARGFGADLSGVLWATGVVADVVFLGVLGWMRRRIPSHHLLMIGGLAALVRWVGFAAAPPIPILFALQALHAFSFTATYLASVELAHKLAADGKGLSTQTTNWALSTGLCAGVGTLFAGPLYAAMGVQGYWVMGGVAVVGLAISIALAVRLRSGRAPYPG
jgi:PPP family 3-phenylpropionic acid transporter